MSFIMSLFVPNTVMTIHVYYSVPIDLSKCPCLSLILSMIMSPTLPLSVSDAVPICPYFINAYVSHSVPLSPCPLFCLCVCILVCPCLPCFIRSSVPVYVSLSHPHPVPSSVPASSSVFLSLRSFIGRSLWDIIRL